MELKEFIKNFAYQFDDTDAKELTEETKFKELDEWSSLIALSIIAMIDEEYNISLVSDDLTESETIADLYNRISK